LKKLFFILPIIVLCIACQRSPDPITQSFDGRYGQVEVGSRFMGLEFHHSRPLPSRLNFYTPVANSVDLSTGYWVRDESLPLTIELLRGEHIDTLGLDGFVYDYSPWSVTFKDTLDGAPLSIAYNFLEDYAAAVLRLKWETSKEVRRNSKIRLSLNPTLRTSHSYKTVQPARITQSEHIRLAYFNDVATDSVVLFLCPTETDSIKNDIDENVTEANCLRLERQWSESKSDEIAFLIGMCGQTKKNDAIYKVQQNWQHQIKSLDRRMQEAVDAASFQTPDKSLNETMRWSKATIASLHHYINDWFLPMPCPAEYNFFFTHDLLVTGLGAMFYDAEFLRNGFEFLHSITEADSILPHAYYWKDDHFQTEKCFSSNWNHLWFIISASAYLKHSGDAAMIEKLYPMLRKSLSKMLENMSDDYLMYAKRPDWWDIGDKYGARAYITTLTIRALEDFSYLSLSLGKEEKLMGYLEKAKKMRAALSERLWDEGSQFLINELTAGKMDKHYYAGSLMAAAYDVLDHEKSLQLLHTAEREMLDKQVGVRNAWPADFHLLNTVYDFKPGEVGKPYFYFNGGVWSQNNAWYALGLIEAGLPDRARDFVTRYMTLEGIQNSPNGQPSFYEYRFTDPSNPNYGAIDKPTFLWAGGWYVHVLYRLAGARTNAWNFYFDANVPSDFYEIFYDVNSGGSKCRVKYHGLGNYFSKILVDGKRSYSAVMMAKAENVELFRSAVEAPYLASANVILEKVDYDKKEKALTIKYKAASGCERNMKIVSPRKVAKVVLNDKSVEQIHPPIEDGDVFVYDIKVKSMTMNNICQVQF
jgi:hypothetical protein